MSVTQVEVIEGIEGLYAAIEGVNETLHSVGGQVARVAHAITPLNAAPGHDAEGGTVTSLTEAVMGVSFALSRIADAIQQHTEAVERVTREIGDLPLGDK